MKKDNLIHVRLDYEEALETKRDVLSIEANLIKIVQAIIKYKELRIRELELKKSLDEKSSVLRADLTQVKTILPKIQIPRIVKKFEEKKQKEEKKEKGIKPKTEKREKEKKEKPQKKVAPPKEDFNAQLQEIQDRLARLR